MKQEKAELKIGGKVYTFPVITGTEGEKGIDISSLRKDTGYITLDPGFGSTGACSSAITYIDGEKGILRYRGYPIEEIAGKVTFTETAYLLLHDKFPTRKEKKKFSQLLTENSVFHEDMKHFFLWISARCASHAYLINND